MLNTHLSRIIVKSYSAQVEKYRRMTGLLNAHVCAHHQCQRAGTGQVRAGVCSEGVRASAFITCRPSDPDPSHFTLLAPVSLLPHCAWRRVAARRTWWHLPWQQLSVSPINYTDWLTPSPTLILGFILPLGMSTIFDITPLPLAQCRPPFLSKTSTNLSVHCQTCRITLFVFYWICCTLQCLTVNMCSLPEVPSDGKLHWSQLCQISFRSTWGGIKWRAIPGTGCLGWGRIRWGSPWLAGVLGYLRDSPVCLWGCESGAVFSDVIVFYPSVCSFRSESLRLVDPFACLYHLSFIVFYYSTHFLSFSSRLLALFYECEVCFHLPVDTA